MDVLAPDLQYIDGICYRINPGEFLSNFDKGNRYIEEDEEEQSGHDTEDEEFEVEMDPGGRYRTNFHVAKVFFPCIIGSKGATRKRLETETRTRITVPKLGHDGDIIVTGSERNNVASARRRINMIVFSARKRQAFTHFISVPFTHSSFKEGFEKFKKDVLKKYNCRGIDESIFQSVDKLHLTFCTLVLCDDIERSLASNALMKCKEEIIGPLLSGQTLKLRMAGVEYMNDDPSEVDVLYGKVFCTNSPEQLQSLADGVVSFFSQQGFIEKEYEKVKLHVTLMNTLFRKGPNVEEEVRVKRETFDARQVIQNFQDFQFGEADFRTIELSLRYSTSKTGYYQATMSIDIP